MANSPILQIPQVAPNQDAKEVTINDGISILERSLNDIRAVDLSVADVTLDITDYTRFMLLRCSGHSVARTLNVPASKRLFMVHNAGTADVTVDPGAGTSQVVPSGSMVVLFNDGVNLIKISDSAASGTVTAFLALPDTPNSFAGQAGKTLAVKATEDGLEFVVFDAADFLNLTDTPNDYSGAAGKYVRVNAAGDGLEFGEAEFATTFLTLTDTPDDYTSFEGKVVAVKADGSGLEFIDPPAGTFLSLSDAPSDYTGFGGKIVAVKTTEDGLEFIDPPEGGGGGGAGVFTDLTDVPSSYSGQGGRLLSVKADESGVEFINSEDAGNSAPFTALHWRIYCLGHNNGPGYYSFAEIELRGTVGGADLTTSDDSAGVAIASGQASGTPANAFDNDTGTRWAAQTGSAQWIGFSFAVPQTIREVSLLAASGNLTEAPKSFVIECSNDLVTWVGVIGFENQTSWLAATPRLFAVPERPIDVNLVVGNTASSTRVLSLDDLGKYLRFTTVCDVTVPTNATVPFLIGTEIPLRQVGAGQVAILADTGVTINVPSATLAKTRGIGSTAHLIKVGPDEWDLTGDLEVVA